MWKINAIVIGTVIESHHDSKFNHVTCGPHRDHEDTSSHLKSVLCMQKLENHLGDTFDKDWPMTLLTQAQGIYIVYFHSEKFKI